MIRALDSRLVAAAQWVVDITQRQPHTLGGLSVALSAVACCARAGSVAFPALSLSLASACSPRATCHDTIPEP